MTFDARQEVTIDGRIKIKYDMFTKSFRVIDVPNRNKEVAKIVEKFTYVKAEPTQADQLAEGAVIEEPTPFDLPKFGVTVLGSSHGFDPNGSTTGFVIWINGRGIMVDPPPGSSQALEKLSIPPRFIEGIILTHCHADHDAGTFQKILKDQAVRMYTTQTIYDSFMRKYAAISGFGPDFLEKLFYHIPVKIGEPLEFHGAQINFFYSFHTIPCVSFEVVFEGESMVYSADTNSDPSLIEKMFAEGAIGQQRRDMLIEKSPLKGKHSERRARRASSEASASHCLRASCAQWPALSALAILKLSLAAPPSPLPRRLSSVAAHLDTLAHTHFARRYPLAHLP